MLIWAHSARVPAAQYMRLTRSTGPNKHSGSDRNARDPLRARALAARSSCAARLSGHEDMHMPSQLHRFDKREAGDHLEARNAATPIASWHADESSAAMANALYDECTAVLDDDPPRARPPSLRARRGYRRSTGSKLPARPHSCSREASRLVVPASPNQFGMAATLWPSRRVSSKYLEPPAPRRSH